MPLRMACNLRIAFPLRVTEDSNYPEPYMTNIHEKNIKVINKHTITTHTHIHTHAYTYMHIYLTYIPHAYMYMHALIYIHAHTCTYIHTHTLGIYNLFIYTMWENPLP